MKLSQEKIDKAHHITNRIFEISLYCLFALGFTILLKPLLSALGVEIAGWACYPTICLVYKVLGAVLGIIAILSIVPTMVLSLWATDDKKEERKEEMKEVLQEISAEKKTRTKTVFYGKSPLIDLSPEQIAVIHKFLCDIPDQGDHIKTSELRHLLHALEAREDIDLKNRNQVIAWVEHITKRSVETSKFWNEYDWRRSKDKEKKWGKKIVEAFDKLR